MEIKKYYINIQLILILWQKVRQTRIFAIVRVFPYYEEAKNEKNGLGLGEAAKQSGFF